MSIPLRCATAEQVLEYELPPILQAKKTSSRYTKFVELHGTDVFEVEAVPPKTLQQILRSTIEAVIDREAFDAEIAAERDDAAFLEGVRRTVTESLRASVWRAPAMSKPQDSARKGDGNEASWRYKSAAGLRKESQSQRSTNARSDPVASGQMVEPGICSRRLHALRLSRSDEPRSVRP